MKFRFTKTKVPAASKNARRLTLRRDASRLPDLFRALQRNEEVDLFGSFDSEEKAKRRGLFALLGDLSQKLRCFFERLREKRNSRPIREPVRSSLLFGAVCGAFSVTAITAVLTLWVLFGNYFGSYRLVSIPTLTSLSEQEALATQNDIFEYAVVYRVNPEYNDGEVISQSPAPSVLRKLYSKSEKIKITLTVNEGEELFSLPELVGMPSRDAALLLSNAGLEAVLIEEYSSTVPSGKIISSSHAKGENVRSGSKIILRVSKGEEIPLISLPSLSGLDETAAIAKLSSLGFALGNITYSASSAPAGTVIAQDIAAGSLLESGARVSLTVSGGKYFETQ